MERPPVKAQDDKLSTLAFRSLVVFSFLYYARPEDAIVPLRLLYVSKIAGFFCLLGLALTLRNRRKMKFPLALTLLLLLLLQMTASVPFAIGWRALALQTVINLPKAWPSPF